MDKLIVAGGKSLKGTVEISGSKNSVLSILAATLLTEEKSVIKNVPNLRDVNTMVKILEYLGVEVNRAEGKIEVIPGKCKRYKAPYELVSTMRASICVLGPLIAKLGYAEVSMPGGCVIGQRPIDLHIKGLKNLGVDINIKRGYIVANAKKFKGANVYLGGQFGSSVLATATVMMAATLAKGKTIIENAACEPEIADLANFLVKMGANIEGIGSHTIFIQGVKRLSGAEYAVIPDRIEAGTYIMAAAITKGYVELKKVIPAHLGAIIDKLRQTGVNIKCSGRSITVKADGKFKPVNLATHPYPGFPTDMQAQFMSFLSLINGISVITEKIYPDRFMHVSELSRMGADIILEGDSAIIRGVKSLSGAPVMASDLRASAALVLAGLVGKNKTEISRVYHLDRGYENIEKKLAGLGASIWRKSS